MAPRLNLSSSQASELGHYVEGLGWVGRGLTGVDMLTGDPGDLGFKTFDAALTEVAGRVFGVPGLLASVAWNEIGGSKGYRDALLPSAMAQVIIEDKAICAGKIIPIFQSEPP